MKYWLIKSEPHTWSWSQQKEVTYEPWEGVRNFQANNYLKQMNINDLAFFYHSGKERRIMGIVKIIKSYYPDPHAPLFGKVDVEFKDEFPNPVSLKQIKDTLVLSQMPLVRQPRLSVSPVQTQEWVIIQSFAHRKKDEI